MQTVFEYPSNSPKSKSLITWFWFFISPHKWLFLSLLFNRILCCALFSMDPMFINQIANCISAGEIKKGLFWGIAMAVTDITAYSLVLFWSKERSLVDSMKRGMSLFAIQHYIDMPIYWHHSEGTGQKLEKIMIARQGFEDLMKLIFYPGGYLLGYLIGSTVALFLNTPPIFIGIFGIYVIAYCAIGLGLGRRLSLLHGKHNEASEASVDVAYEFVSSINTVKAEHLRDYVTHLDRQRETSALLSVNKVFNFYYAWWSNMKLTGFIGFAVVAIFCIYLLDQGSIATATCLTTLWIFQTIWFQLENAVEVEGVFFSSKAALAPLIHLLIQPKEKLDVEPFYPYPLQWNELVFKNVSFSYPNSRVYALHDINLTIKRNEHIALVGVSGSGKSTFAKLLMKLLKPSRGQILIDGMDLRHIKLSSYSQRITLIPQEVELFNISIMDNISLNNDLCEQEVIECLRDAHALDFVMKLPHRWHSVVGERGVSLSGGQRQRIGIARALAKKKAQIIIFDECTSHLDSESEIQIQQATQKLFENKTVITIAHRLATIQNVDRILVFDHGALVEQGDFDSLIRANGVFANFWKLQTEAKKPWNAIVKASTASMYYMD